ncbi:MULTISPECIES: riboflavin synthase [unclassified Halanaerobium]|uniref:riboflavin synthase n=1 Tax=unclassified Halanaerobium TaxID=2641197 RepID=UPI001EEB9DB8|nr:MULTISPECIES: riboflavin synthase [unclassified Halanaerobium]
MVVFTGIVQETGKLQNRIEGATKYQLKISADKVLIDIKKGDSIAVNGVCLTVVDFDSSSFTADVMPETLNSTNLSDLKSSSIINLEQSLRMNDFVGGHFVTGHVDGTAVLRDIKREKNAHLLQLVCSDNLTQYIVKKGSAALNGVSLTVMDIKENILTISLIPETWSSTNFKYIKRGDRINIEADILGKYVLKLLGKDRNQVKSGSNNSSITADFLKKNGFY